MSKNILKYIGNQVSVHVSGGNQFNGILTDLGQDILVLYNGRQFLYIPLSHIHQIQLNINTEEHVNQPTEAFLTEEMDPVTFQKVLNNAKNFSTEIAVVGSETFHGVIKNVYNDYFTFYSPIYKLMYIPINHLKWLIPYAKGTTPYTMTNADPPNIPLLHTLEEQLRTEIGKLVVFDGGEDPFKIGLLKNVEQSIVELTIASGEAVFLTIDHIKSVQLP
ncbi:DUF2642 domain-containing protein [Bacillus sp. CGMCC 1.16607]|uniref:DUF2642 domain-containing protein n=1 Tax=Bacillus sp. CGMCC 1.16607 TaxID=3351842 RepID=UPI00362A2044